jgi:hypothetical protein
MAPSSTPSMDKQSRDATYWAQPVSTMKVRKAPTGALNLNIDGHQLVGPLQGFGQLWQKTFRVRLSGSSVTPTEVIKTWKENFPEFWPKWDHFYKPATGIAPGEVGIINMLLPGDIPVGVPISTGVLIIYADDESFTFMNPLGHMFAGWITFSAYEEQGCTIAQIQLLVRCNDPIYEIGFRLGASHSENRFWQYILKSLAGHYNVSEPVQTRVVCVDPKVQWSQFWNIWQNASIRTVLYHMLTPMRWVRRQRYVKK